MISKYVFTGPMRSGKSTLIDVISKKIEVYRMAEVAQYLIDREKSCKRPESEWVVPWNETKFYGFQHNVFKTQLEWEKDMEKNSKYSGALLDRSLIDGLAYIRLAKFKGKKGYDELYNLIFNEAKKREYSQIFMCEFISKPAFEDKNRKDLDDAAEISALLWDVYRTLGYRPIFVPASSIERRTELILKNIK